MAKAREVDILFVQPSSVCGMEELKLGVASLEKAGFKVGVHPQCSRKYLFLAGTDQERADAFYEAALSSAPIVWSARGGYGAFRLLDLLRKKKKPRQRKLFVGYSDATALFDFVIREWGWSVLHAPMPGLRNFHLMDDVQWDGLRVGLRGAYDQLEYPKLKALAGTARLLNQNRSISGSLFGGNLCTLASLAGSGALPSSRGKILFFEDVDEQIYRVDRFVWQLKQAGFFKGAKAIVLGTFNSCRDGVPQVLKALPQTVAKDLTQVKELVRKADPKTLEPLRPLIDSKKAIEASFGEIARLEGIPLLGYLPVGHGLDGQFPLPIAEKATISGGRLSFAAKKLT